MRFLRRRMGIGIDVGLGGVASVTQSLIAQFGGFWADPDYGGAVGMAAQPTPTDWDMEAAGTAQWTPTNDTLVKDANPHSGTQCLKGTSTATPCYATQGGMVVVGNRYTGASVWGCGDGATGYPYLYNDGGIGISGNTSVAWQYLSIPEFTAGNPNFRLWTQPTTGVFSRFDDLQIGANLSVLALTPRYSAAINCLADGDCEDSGTAAWTVGAGGGSLSKVAGALRVTSVTTATCARQVLVTGRQYRLTGIARGDGGSGIPRVNMSAAIWTGTNSASDQAIDVTFTATSNNCDFYNSGTSGVVDFDTLVLTDVSTPAGILAQSTAANQPWLSTTTVNGRRVLQFADTDVLLGSLAAPAWRFLHCGSGGTLPRWIYNRNLNSSSLAAINTILRTYAAGTKAGVWVYVTTAGAITVTWYDATGAVLQTAASANGAVVAGTAYAITVWVDGTSFGVLKNGADAIAATAMTFTPDMTLPSNYQSGNGTGTPIVGLCSNEVLVAGYRDAASTLALHREQASQWGIAA